MTDEAKRCIEALRVRCRERDSCDGCAKDDYCHHHGDEALHDFAAHLIESLAAELEQVTRERDGLQMEFDELKEEYYTDIHTARDPMEDKVKQLERERDAAVEDIKIAALHLCDTCKHRMPDERCRHFGGRESDAIVCGVYEWRGVKEDNHA